MSRYYSGKKRKRVLMALSYYDMQIHQGIIQYAQQAKWVLETSMVHYGYPPSFWSGDGIITIFLPPRPEITEYVLSKNCPVVALYNDVPEAKVNRVLLNNYKVGTLAAEYFLARQFRHFAFARFTNFDAVQERIRGFRERLAFENVDCFHLDFTTKEKITRENEDFRIRIGRSLAKLPKPLALFAQSDHRANLLIAVCTSLGISIPEEISILGVDNNTLISRFAQIPISSVDCCREQMGFQAAQRLDALMNGSNISLDPIVIEPWGVVTRQSSDYYATDNQAAVRAIRFIEDHFCEPIGVNQVVRASRTGRSSLYSEFIQIFGRSIAEEISFRRIVHACDLLRESDYSIATVAMLSGFQKTETFCRVFKRFMNTTPKEYRTFHENDFLIKKKISKRTKKS